MALINCPECKGMVSNKANHCIHCGYPLNNILTRTLRKIVQYIIFKKIPKDIIQIRNWKFLLSFKDTKYDFYTTKFFYSLTKKPGCVMEFYSLNGDISWIRFFGLPREYREAFENKATNKERLLYFLGINENESKLFKENKLVPLRKEIFNNGYFEGAIAEYVTKQDPPRKLATVVYIVFPLILTLDTLVPSVLPEDLYQEIIKILKSCHGPSELFEEWGASK